LNSISEEYSYDIYGRRIKKTDDLKELKKKHFAQRIQWGIVSCLILDHKGL